MANRYANLTPGAAIKDDFGKITAGFDAVQAEMDTTVRRRTMVLDPGIYDDLDVTNIDLVFCRTSEGNITINSIIAPSGHRVRIIKYFTAGILTVKHDIAKNMYMADTRDIVFGSNERYGFVEVQFYGNSKYGNVVARNISNFAQVDVNNIFTQNQTIHKDLPRTFYRPTSNSQTAHGGEVFTDAEGVNKWVQGHIPNSGIFALYDYVNATNRLVFETGPDMRATLNGISVFRSQVSPEGSLTAGPGSICSVWAGSGTVGLWVKMTGSGNTGWKRVATE